MSTMKRRWQWRIDNPWTPDFCHVCHHVHSPDAKCSCGCIVEWSIRFKAWLKWEWDRRGGLQENDRRNQK